MLPKRVFVQVGATRDGLDPYLMIARLRDFRAVLIETPEYLNWRRCQGRDAFDEEIAVAQPENSSQLISGLRSLDKLPDLVLPGFERYVRSTYRATRALSLSPGAEAGEFQAPYKTGQRIALATTRPSIGQPQFQLVSSLEELVSTHYHLSPPVIVKPDDGGAGLGVLMLSQLDDMAYAVKALTGTTNYGGGKFASWVVEQYLSGTELSIQAVAREGKAHILAFCEKLVTVEPRVEGALLCGFRESGHVAYPGDQLDQDLASLAQQCIEAVGYATGPFHIDLIRTGKSLYFLEMGFRLSGMRVLELVDHVSGLSWADEAFRAHLGDIPGIPVNRGNLPYMGHLVLRNEAQMSFASTLKSVVGSANVKVTRSASRDHARKSTVPTALLADVTRHIDVLGRVSVQASNPRLVMHLLMCCKDSC